MKQLLAPLVLEIRGRPNIPVSGLYLSFPKCPDFTYLILYLSYPKFNKHDRLTCELERGVEDPNPDSPELLLDEELRVDERSSSSSLSLSSSKSLD